MSAIELILESIANILGKIVFFNVFSIFGIDTINLPITLFLLIIGYIVMMFKLNFVQFFHFKESIKYSFGKKEGKKQKDEISSLKTLLASVAGCTGVNAIAGMVFMVAAGGPGTVFWVPILAFLCMAFRFAEVYLSHYYRSGCGSEALGGPFDYMKKGLLELGHAKLGKVIAFIYAFLMILGGCCAISMIEANQFVSVLNGSFNCLNGKKLLSSIIMISCLAYILLGGTKRIINVMSTILPVIAIAYVVVSLIVILVNINKLGDVCVLIFQDAMKPRSIAGGFIASLCMCVRKTALAHETGLGTSGLVHASSSEKDSIREATGAMLTPLINCLICMMSSVVLIITGLYQSEYVESGAVAIFQSFKTVNNMLPYVVTIVMPLLTMNVLIGWSNYVVKCSRYCFNNNVIMVRISMLVFLLCAFIGGNVDSFTLVMNLVDPLLYIMVIINVPTVIVLGGKVKKELKKYKFK